MNGLVFKMFQMDIKRGSKQQHPHATSYCLANITYPQKLFLINPVTVAAARTKHKTFVRTMCHNVNLIIRDFRKAGTAIDVPVVLNIIIFLPR